MNSIFWRTWHTVLFALLLAGTNAAWAHSSSNSYLLLTEENGARLLRADVHLRDVDVVFDLDADRDGQLVWGEVVARKAEVETWLLQGLRVGNDAATCDLSAADVQASELADGIYLSTEWRLACPPEAVANGQELQLTYSLLFDRDNLHRALLRIDLPQVQTSAILSPEQPIASLATVNPSVVDVLKRYIFEGVWHIWIGIDHILFLLSLLVLAPLVPARCRVTRWAAEPWLRPALMDVLAVVTAFTVAHSITLSLSVLQWVEPPASFIEPVIAISVVLAAINNLLGWWSVRRWRLAFVFGLIHGFGFANVLLDVGLPARELAVALGGFNLGVELGQLAIVLAFFPLAWWLRHTAFYRWVVVIGGSIAIVAVGTVWTVQRVMG